MSNRLSPFFLLLTLSVICACNGKIVDDPASWPIDPIEVFIQINEEFGDNLLETSAQGNWHESTFRCLFEDTYYLCDKDTEIDPAYIQNPEYFYGISISGLILDQYTTIPVISFGAFSGKRQMDDDIVFYWPDGSEDTIHIWNHFYYNDKGYPITQRKIYLNGEESSNWITLIKQPLASSEPEDE